MIFIPNYFIYFSLKSYIVSRNFIPIKLYKTVYWSFYFIVNIYNIYLRNSTNSCLLIFIKVFIICLICWSVFYPVNRTPIQFKIYTFGSYVLSTTGTNFYKSGSTEPTYFCGNFIIKKSKVKVEFSSYVLIIYCRYFDHNPLCLVSRYCMNLTVCKIRQAAKKIFISL